MDIMTLCLPILKTTTIVLEKVQKTVQNEIVISNTFGYFLASHISMNSYLYGFLNQRHIQKRQKKSYECIMLTSHFKNVINATKNQEKDIHANGSQKVMSTIFDLKSAQAEQSVKFFTELK